MKNNHISKKIAFLFKLGLVTPLCVSSGEAQWTDCDVQRDYFGTPFVPGTSLAGAMRGYLELTGSQREADSLFGADKISSLQISDGHFNKNNDNNGSSVQTVVRDGVKLKNRIAVDGAKFDMEAVEAGVGMTFSMLLTIRNETSLLATLKKIIYGLDSGDIRLGAKKNRGFGQIAIKSLYVREFDFSQKDDVEKWLGFQLDNPSQYDKVTNIDQWKIAGNPYAKVTVPLELTGGISIRRYSVKTGEADFCHITYPGKVETPVIPGSSWTGAIRDRSSVIIREIIALRFPDISADEMEERVNGLIDMAFGFVRERTKEACQSHVIIDESQLEKSRRLRITRNKIDRFSGATVDGALFTEEAYFGGTTCLNVKIWKNDGCDWIIGLLQLVFDDLDSGYMPVGGQVGIGRGYFKVNGSIQSNIEDYGSDRYRRALSEKIAGGL